MNTARAPDGRRKEGQKYRGADHSSLPTPAQAAAWCPIYRRCREEALAEGLAPGHSSEEMYALDCAYFGGDSGGCDIRRGLD